MQRIDGDANSTLDPFAFLCTKTSRPKVKFEIEEINRYGQRVYVQKRSEYEPLDMSFIDDDQNATHNALSILLSLLIPNSNLSESPTIKDVMLFNGGISAYAGSMAAYAELSSETTGFLLERINVYQMFRWGNYVNKYTYYNPIVSSLAMSDADTTGNTESNIDMSFRYGSVSFSTFSINESGVKDPRGNPFSKFHLMNVGKEGAASTMLSGDGSQKAPKSFMGGPYSVEQRLAKYKVPLDAKPSLIDRLKTTIKERVKNGIKNFINAFDLKIKLDGNTDLGFGITGNSIKQLITPTINGNTDLGFGITGNSIKDALSVNIGIGLTGQANSFASKISDVKDKILGIGTATTFGLPNRDPIIPVPMSDKVAEQNRVQALKDSRGTGNNLL